jgi:hypothetical protein
MIRQHRHYKRQCATAILVPALLLLPVFAGADTTGYFESSASPQSVLIVQKDSYLENAVSAIVKDSLSARGFSIKIISPESLKDEKPTNYRATIIMSAIQSSKIRGVVRSYARALDAEQSNILIFSVYGEEWKTNKVIGDAVAGATKKLNPANVAAKILERIDSIAPPR